VAVIRLIFVLASAVCTVAPAQAGERLVWNAQIDGRWTVMTRDANGEAREWLPASTADIWVWSQAGTDVLLLSRPQRGPGVDRRWRAYAVGADGSGLRRLSEQPVADGMPGCRPGLADCLFEVVDGGRKRILAYNADGTTRHPVGIGPWSDTDPQYSPDGTRLLFRSDRSGSWELWSMRLPEGPFRQLTRDDANDAVPRHEYGGEGPARFSPDGRHIVWMRRFPDRGYDIWRMDPADGTAMNLTADSPHDDAYPAFSPDGARIVFDSDRSGDNEIYVMSAQGSDVQRITRRDGSDLAPLWIVTPEDDDED
jgi:TolB protein